MVNKSIFSFPKALSVAGYAYYTVFHGKSYASYFDNLKEKLSKKDFKDIRKVLSNIEESKNVDRMLLVYTSKAFHEFQTLASSSTDEDEQNIICSVLFTDNNSTPVRTPVYMYGSQIIADTYDKNSIYIIKVQQEEHQSNKLNNKRITEDVIVYLPPGCLI